MLVCISFSSRVFSVFMTLCLWLCFAVWNRDLLTWCLSRLLSLLCCFRTPNRSSTLFSCVWVDLSSNWSTRASDNMYCCFYSISVSLSLWMKSYQRVFLLLLPLWTLLSFVRSPWADHFLSVIRLTVFIENFPLRRRINIMEAVSTQSSGSTPGRFLSDNLYF